MKECNCCQKCQDLRAVDVLIAGLAKLVKSEIRTGFLEVLKEIQILEDLKTLTEEKN